MQAIQTKYLCPTNVRGSRYKAWCERGSITLSANDALNSDDNHKAAAEALKQKFCKEDEARYGPHKNPWSAPTVFGTLPDGTGAHVYS